MEQEISQGAVIAAQNVDALSQYANIIIPLVISFLGGLITFWVTQSIIKEKVKRLEEDMKEVQTQTQGIRDKVIVCETTLKEREPLTKRKSPVTLTDRGIKLLNESGGKKFVEDNFDELYKELEGKKPKTSYDVQEYGREVIEGMTNDDKFILLKDYLFKEGTEISDLVTVMSIHFRDKTLSKKGWNVTDIDKHEQKQEIKQNPQNKKLDTPKAG